MKLTGLFAENFRSFEARQFDFVDQTVIRAMNAHGKSTIAEAIVWCLYGTDIRGKAKMDGELVRTGAADMRVVTQWLVENGSLLTVERTKPSKGATRVLVNGAKATPGQVEGLFFPYVNEFLSVFIPGFFSSLEPKDAKAILARYSDVSPEEVLEQLSPDEQMHLKSVQFGLGFDSVEVFRKKLADQIKSEQAEKLRLEGEVRVAEETLQAGKPEPPKSRVTATHIQNFNTYKQNLEALNMQKDIANQLQDAMRQREGVQTTSMSLRNTLMAIEENCPVCGHQLDDHKKKRANLKVHAHNVPIQTHLNKLEQEEESWNKQILELQSKQREQGPVPSDEDVEKWEDYISRVEAQVQIERDLQTRYTTQMESYTKSAADLEERRGFLAQHENIVAMLETQLAAVKSFRFQYVRVQQAKLDSLFKRVKIVLSKVNEDGEIKDAFQITWNGKSYRTLSTSEKVRCDLEIGRAIAALSKNEPMPVFVDNAEGVQNLFDEHLDRQTIAAYVFSSQLVVQERKEAVHDIEAELNHLHNSLVGQQSMQKGA